MRWIRTSRARMRCVLVCLGHAHLRDGGEECCRGQRRRHREANGFPCNQPECDKFLGTDILRPNQSGGGSHVANAGFMVSAKARGQGIVAQWLSIA